MVAGLGQQGISPPSPSAPRKIIVTIINNNIYNVCALASVLVDPKEGAIDKSSSSFLIVFSLL